MSSGSFPPIQQRLMQFVRERFHPGYNHYNVSKLVGDASARQYYRYVTNTGESFILAAYPEAFDPDRFTYKQIYDLLQEIDVPVPEIVQMDGPLGIVLQEDLGNDSLQKTLIDTDEREKIQILRRAVNLIVEIQDKGTGALQPQYEANRLAFDEEKLNWEFSFFFKHFVGNYRRLAVPDQAKLFGEFQAISAELAAYPRVLCHRDFHVRNMMVKKGVIYVIDFQDARWGPPAYDVCSLLKDSLELESAAIEELIDFYLETVRRRGLLSCPVEALEPDAFLRQFNLMSIQRLLKALGTYAYQIIVRENFIYEQYMAGSLHRALISLEAIGEFPEIRRLVERELDTRR